MLASLTWLTEALGMVLGLWLAAYLVSYGFRNPVTRAMAITLAAIASGFFVDLLAHAMPSTRLAAWWTLALTVALIGWYNVTWRLFAPRTRRNLALAVVINGLGIAKLGLVGLVLLRADLPPTLTSQTVAPCCAVAYMLADYTFLLLGAAGLVINFRLGRATASAAYRRPLEWAAWLGALVILYNIAYGLAPDRLPQLPRDLLLVAGLALGGYAVARYQAFIEFRPLRRDLPTSALTAAVLVAAYGWLARQLGASEQGIVLVLAVAVLTHAIYSAVHATLDFLLHRHVTDFRQQLRRLARVEPDADRLGDHLQAGLERLVRLLDAPAGFVATRQGGEYAVQACVGMLTRGERLPPGALAATEITRRDGWRPGGGTLWLTPLFSGAEQAAVIGLAPRMDGMDYGAADLDLLEDVADWAGRLIEAEAQQRARRAELLTLAQGVARGEDTLQTQANLLATTLAAQPDREFTRAVERGLQHLADYAHLGASPLVKTLRVSGATHIERGKAVRERLLAALESLRPAGKRPGGAPPKEWLSYAILYDAYVDDQPNKQIQVRLELSEGGFNRTRRQAVRAVSQALLEGQPAANPD
ncbi:MAG: hypothetical protein IT317_20690 [Anaerolineales bacterium]|nr:hypothetical protein [Anaerolineales bacterium]